MGLKRGEVEFLTVFVRSNTDVRALGPYTKDLIVQVHSNESSGVWVGTKRVAVRRGDNRAQVYSSQIVRFPLGKDQILWIRNTNAPTSAEVNLSYWLAGDPV
ncbi:MAG: hypothetical protein JXB32_15910 [Deltaproteobacteria bacterium]|nr:hypothetical protein [Deltaproteobacteria bacterium]